MLFVKTLNRPFLISCCALLVLFNSPLSQAEQLPPFSDWSEKNFLGKNRYQFSQVDGQHQVRVDSDKSASGLFLEKTIDLNKTPVLSWSWKISNVLSAVSERSKKGDDFAVRIYVLASTGPFPWQKHTLAYVWSNYQQVGESWKNPYTDKVIMLALNSGEELANTWQRHRRNVQDDLFTAFGVKYDQIEVLAIMTDTDNSLKKTTGWYKNISFEET